MRPVFQSTLSRRRRRSPLLWILPAFALLITGCIREHNFAPDAGDDTREFSLPQARNYFRGQNQPITFPCVDPAVRNAGTGPFHNLLVPEWEMARSVSARGIVSHEIPLINQRNLSGIFTRSGAVNVVSSLVIQKNIARDTARQFIFTAIGYVTDPSGFDGYRFFEPGKPHSAFFYFGDRSAFSGITILSDLDGRCRYAAYYYLGKYMPVKLGLPDSSKTPLFSLKLYPAPEKTKWAGGYDGWFYCYTCHQETQFYGGICSLCGNGNEELGEIVIYPPDSGNNYECPEHG